MTLKKTKKCSIRDLAKHVNVSPGTISRVLNSKPSNIKITEATKKRIFTAVKELNYSPNIHAKRLFANKSMTIGVVIPEQRHLVNHQHTFSDFNLAETLSGIERTATANNYRLLLLVRTEEFMSEKGYLDIFREKCIDGLIFWGVGSDAAFNKELMDEKLPFVLANSNNIDSNVPTVICDNISGSFKTTEYLIKKGCKNIVHLQGKAGSPVNSDREAGVLKAFKKYKLKLNKQLVIHGDYSIESGYRITQKLIAKKLKFDALIAGNDMMAVGAMNALLQAGIKIPEDVSVTGADNIQLGEYASVPLTTYFSNMFEVGKEAINLLISQINNDKKVHKQVVIPTELIIRQSA